MFLWPAPWHKDRAQYWLISPWAVQNQHRWNLLLYTVLYMHYVAWSPVLLGPLLQNSNLFLQLLNSQQVISTSLPFHTYLLLFHVPALLEEAALRWFFKQKNQPTSWRPARPPAEWGEGRVPLRGPDVHLKAFPFWWSCSFALFLC